MARGVAHDDRTKAAVLGSLLAGQSVSEVAREYRLSRATVIAWREASGVGSTPVQREKRDDLGDLVSRALSSYLTTVSVLAERTQDAAWCAKQSAADMAVLIGVLTDKAVRILEAIDAADPGQPGVDPAPPPDPA